MSGLLSIGSSAIDAAYVALQTTGNNIANVNTPGYSRQIATFATQVETGVGAMYMGSGVDVTGVTRMYSDLLGQQTNAAQAQAGQADTAAQLLGQINSMFADPTTGLSTAMDNFFSQVQAVSANPGSAATRQSMLSAAQQMAGQFNGMYAQLQQLGQSTTQQIAQQITTANTTIADIANLNSQIAAAQAAGGMPNSLLDQRNQDILTLNKAVGVTTTAQGGAINVYLANGQPLVVGAKAYPLAQGPDPNNPQNTIVGTTSGSTIIPLEAGNTGGGAIGALLQFQNQTIPSVENQIGQLAVVMSAQMNAVQAQGQDLNGNSAANNPGLFSANLFSPMPAIPVVAGSANTGTATVTASYSNVTQLQPSDYQLSVQGSGASRQYVVTQLSDGQQTTYASMPQTINGVTIQLSGTANSGDVFTIQPVRNGAQNLNVAITNGSQIAAASPLNVSTSLAAGSSISVANLGLQPLAAGSSTPSAAAPTSYGPNPNLQDPVTINFSSATQYTYTDSVTHTTSAPQSYTPGQPINVNGWSLTLNGTPVAGDAVTVAPTGSSSGDNRNALLMGQAQTLTLATGATLDNAYAATVGDVGSMTSTAQTTQTSADALLQSASAAQASVSGVNLNEEAANLLQYQQQYQAAATIIQTANTIFNTVLQVASSA